MESVGDWAWRKVKARILHQNDNDTISSGKTEWLNFEFGFNALGFIAPDKLRTKEVLDYLRTFLGKKLAFSSPDPYNDWVQARSWATSISLCWPRETCGTSQDIYFKRKVSLCQWDSANQILLKWEKKFVQWSKLTSLWAVLTSISPASPRRCHVAGLCFLWICFQGT